MKDLKNLQSFSMYHSNLKNIDFDAFEELTELKYLTLNNNNIERFTFAHVKDCTKIKLLMLSGNPIKGDLDFSALGLKEFEPMCFKRKFLGWF